MSLRACRVVVDYTLSDYERCLAELAAQRGPAISPIRSEKAYSAFVNTMCSPSHSCRVWLVLVTLHTDPLAIYGGGQRCRNCHAYYSSTRQMHGIAGRAVVSGVRARDEHASGSSGA